MDVGASRFEALFWDGDEQCCSLRRLFFNNFLYAPTKKTPEEWLPTKLHEHTTIVAAEGRLSFAICMKEIAEAVQKKYECPVLPASSQDHWAKLIITEKL
jgi:hypothetical protein